ncbi:MAG: HD domain-containing phosphohydrolase [Nitrospiraceae bacterium]
MNIDETQITNAKLLLVDDEMHNLQLLEAMLREAGYTRITSTSDSRQVLPLYLEHQPDLLVLDLKMPHLDGFAVMRQLTPRVSNGGYLPILILTAEITPEVKHEALRSGAKDFLTKPFDTTEVLLRIRNMLTTSFLQRELRSQNEHLEEQVRGRTRELDEAQLEILRRLALAAEYRDDETGEHTLRVGQLSAILAEHLGWLPGQVELMRRAAPLHDIGKIGIPDRILLKANDFTARDLEEMRDHVTIGSKILSGSRSSLLQLAEVIALTHHERWDGTGYMRLKGQDIPMSGRIVTVADVFDALTHRRPYKEAWSLERARAEIAAQAGRQFDPQVVEAFLSLLDREGEQLLFKPNAEKVLF